MATTCEATLFKIGMKVVWSDTVDKKDVSFLTAIKEQLGEGPFVVIAVSDVPSHGRYDARCSQRLQIDGDEKHWDFSGYWFKPAAVPK